MRTVTISQFKDGLAGVLEGVRSSRTPVLITKGRVPVPVAMLFPVNHEGQPVDVDGQLLFTADMRLKADDTRILAQGPPLLAPGNEPTETQCIAEARFAAAELRQDDRQGTQK